MTVLPTKKANKTPIKTTDFKGQTSEIKSFVREAVTKAKDEMKIVNPDIFWTNYSLHAGKATPIHRIVKGMSM